ncbi:MAG: hypothetical protein A2135_03260 [Actinobacteria bacterium RBG_16_67_15]|nr:MAG: hypothetical protein A2135_03260 [Actinobacteria bacterium RBG_16_67_15]
MTSNESVLVELDQRRRVSLGKLGHADHTRYLASVEPDGTIVLRPAVVMTELEARLLANGELVDSISDQRTRPKEYVPRPE